MWCITLIELWILKNLFIPGINPTQSSCLILLTYCWEPLQLLPWVFLGLRRVRDLCRVLQLPPTFEDTAVAYYQQAHQLAGIRTARLQKKEVLAGCCVLITCRQRNWPLTMGTICTLLYADLDVFSGTYMQIVKLLGLDVPSLCLVDLVKTYCSRYLPGGRHGGGMALDPNPFTSSCLFLTKSILRGWTSPSPMPGAGRVNPSLRF